jgi:hypothetical protein
MQSIVQVCSHGLSTLTLIFVNGKFIIFTKIGSILPNSLAELKSPGNQGIPTTKLICE